MNVLLAWQAAYLNAHITHTEACSNGDDDGGGRDGVDKAG